MLRTTIYNARWSSQYKPQFVLSTQDQQHHQPQLVAAQSSGDHPYEPQLTHSHRLPISPSHNRDCVYPLSRATNQGISFRATTQRMLQQISTLKPSYKAFVGNLKRFENYNPQTPTFTSSIFCLLILHIFDVILKLILAATSDNSPLRLQATTCSSHVRIIQLQTMICNTEWRSLIQTTMSIRHETTSFTSYNREEQSSEPSVLGTTIILILEFQCHQAPTQNGHMFTPHYKLQLVNGPLTSHLIKASIQSFVESSQANPLYTRHRLAQLQRHQAKQCSRPLGEEPHVASQPTIFGQYPKFRTTAQRLTCVAWHCVLPKLTP